MSNKEVDEKISALRAMVKESETWRNCERKRIAEINREYASAISMLALSEVSLGRIDAEKRVIDRLGDCLIPFSAVGSEYTAAAMALKIAVMWRWECRYHLDNKDKADAFKHSRLQLCAAANMPLWVGALYASELASAVASTKPTDF